MKHVALFVLLVIGVLVFMPLLIIWSLNALFALTIPYTIQTWAAALVLGTVVGAPAASARS